MILRSILSPVYAHRLRCRPMRLASPIRTVLTVANGLLVTAMASIAVTIVGLIRPESPWVDKIAVAWAKACLWPSGVRLDIRGADNVDPDTSYVVVSNHQSTFDIMAHFIAIPVPIRFLAKKELFSVPLLGWALKAMSMVPVDRKARSSYRKVEEGALRVAKLGKSIIVYPEGTRTRDGNLLPFKRGAFAIAVHTGLPILPTTIYGGNKAWVPNQKRIEGGPITVSIGAPIPTAGLTDGDVSRLRDETKAVIQDTLDELSRVLP
ncbi:MAG TPA: 1-acyl-sn-glycerol-3-phosphate acyltransferase [Actinobacteria bacterium]|nr:1-acyl-sn-glycerol-3-phosphate acyltransferase [Actinomycetota bacterium]